MFLSSLSAILLLPATTAPLGANGFAQLSLPGGPISLASGDLAGPSWVVYEGDKRVRVPVSLHEGKVQGTLGALAFTLTANPRGEGVEVRARLSNPSQSTAVLPRCGLLMGIDTNMDKYPEWNDTFFPTLLRCEKTHFWGYLMTPKGRILTISSPDPIASYALEYNVNGHRIKTFELDLLQATPLPSRNPKTPTTLKAGGSLEWRIDLHEAASLGDVKPTVAALALAPMVDASRYSLAPGESTDLTIFSATGKPQATATGPDGKTVRIPLAPAGPNRYRSAFTPERNPGVTTLEVSSKGRVSQAKVSVLRPWSWYMEKSRAAAMRYRQKASSHMESVNGFFPAFMARHTMPNPGLDRQTDTYFWRIFNLEYKGDNLIPQTYPDRIQNTAAYAELLARLFESDHNPETLRKAAKLADFLMTKQHSDGGYYNGGTLYTSVVYLGKSMMEVGLVEHALAKTLPAGSEWDGNARRHLESAFRAMDDLADKLDNIQTEGEQTYEDGMIACSAAQLGMAALICPDPARTSRYRAAAEHFIRGHRCLEQLLIPDSRMNGGTLRFWESQYDVMLEPDMMCSPHGWSAWRIYGEMYRYLATGDIQSLRWSMNALGSCAQLMDYSGTLHWAFVPDPYIQASMFVPDPAKPGWGKQVPKIVGEQPIDMVSDWWQAPTDRIVGGYVNMDDKNPGPACDNDVQEIFKCVGELAVTQAYVAETAPGRYESWNCRVKSTRHGLLVTPDEACVGQVHFNVKRPTSVTVAFATSHPRAVVNGLQWVIGKGIRPTTWPKP